MKQIHDAVVCEGCDALYQRPRLRSREVARCTRCGTELARHPGGHVPHMLPLALTSLVLFALANGFPIVGIELRGASNATTLMGAVIALGREGVWLVALLVLATTIVFPLLHLLALIWLLLPSQQDRPAAELARVAAAMQAVRPWAMVEVFMLGVLVALVKLSSLATVLPGPGLWAFVALTVVATVVMPYDPRSTWVVPGSAGGAGQ